MTLGTRVARTPASLFTETSLLGGPRYPAAFNMSKGCGVRVIEGHEPLVIVGTDSDFVDTSADALPDSVFFLQAPSDCEREIKHGKAFGTLGEDFPSAMPRLGPTRP